MHFFEVDLLPEKFALQIFIHWNIVLNALRHYYKVVSGERDILKESDFFAICIVHFN